MLAKITMIGLQTHLNYNNDDLFDGIVLPQNIDKETLIDTIMMEGGEFPFLYAEPTAAKYFVKNFFKRYKQTFEKWDEALNLEYNVLDNYDGYSEITNQYGEKNRTDNLGAEHESQNLGSTKQTMSFGQQSDSTTYGQQSTSSVYGNRKTTQNIDAVTNTTTDKVSAYDSENWSNKDQSQNQLGAQKNTTAEDSWTDSNTSQSHTDTINRNAHSDVVNTDAITNTSDKNARVNTSKENAYEDKIIERKHGNLGLTTSMQLIESEMEMRKNYNIYNLISDLFIENFCLQVYA